MSAPPLDQLSAAQYALAVAEADRFLQGFENEDREFQYPLAPRQCLLEMLEVITDEMVRFRHQPGAGWKIIELEILKGKIEKRNS